MNGTEKDTNPRGEIAGDDDSALPDTEDMQFDLAVEHNAGPLAHGRAVILRHARHAPSAPGVYRMIDAAGAVLYVGKAKNIKRRILSYARPTGQDSRIARMVAATTTMEFVSTRTETEALLLEANLIKRLRPRFNVLLRDDKSFPYIVITSDHWAPQLLKHRGARNKPGAFYGPFASVWAVNRTITALQRAFLLRSCSDSFFESRTRPCLLHQIKRCAAPCTGEIDFAGYAKLVGEANAFLSGRSRAVKERLAAEMEQASQELEFERAALYRDRLAALSAVQAQQGINPKSTEEADVFAIHLAGGFSCVEVFFFRTGQNWGNRAYFPKADRSLAAAEILGAFLAQFYDDKPCPRLILLSHAVEDGALLAEALSVKSGHKIEISVPQRGEKKELVAHALANAREALSRKLSDTSAQSKLLGGVAEAFGLPHPPRRIEIYDNSHIQGTNAVGAMVVAGPEGFIKGQYRKFNIRSDDITPGDDYGMMREVLRRRFKRLVTESPRPAPPVPVAEAAPLAAAEERMALAHEVLSTLDLPPADSLIDVAAADAASDAESDVTSDLASPWPDLVLIDGGKGQLSAAQEVMAEIGVSDVVLVSIAKGPDRDAGMETFFMGGRAPFKLRPRDPTLYYLQRLRDEAHRFAIGSHRTRRKKDIRESGLQEIPGVGPARKRALLHHFGTLKAIERASVADLGKVAGVSAETARKIYDYFHDTPGA